MKKIFIEKVADELLKSGTDKFFETVIIFPNRRPKIFLKRYLMQKVKGNIWLPEMLSIDEFIDQLCEFTVQDTFLTWFELYSIHKNIEREKSSDPSNFLNWAPIILNDFIDADRALADVESLFDYLSEVKAMERWHPDKPLSDFEKNYVRFYSNLKNYYNHLNNRLESKGECTAGRQYRLVAENIENKNKLPWNYFVFAGFNALTAAEIKIMKELTKRGVATLLWDIDEVYINPSKFDLPFQESGMFLKKVFKELKIDRPKWIDNRLLNDKKDIKIISVPKKEAQVKVAARLIKDNFIDNENIKLETTAVVLSDESLLLPLLTSLPPEGEYNITMGYPLSYSSLYRFFDIWLDMLILQERQKNDKIQTEKVISLLNNPVVRMTVSNADEIIEKIKKKNVFYIDKKSLLEIFSEDNSKISKILFNNGLKPENILTIFLEFIKYLKEIVDDIENKEGEENFIKKFPLLKQQISDMMLLTKKIFIFLENNNEETNLEILKKLLLHLVSNSSVDLKGEPLNGIQIMGMLETRLLDFDNIIVLSANEGNLPKTGFSDSFIPLDIKSTFNLPVPTEKTAIYAYHFFRLLERTNKAWFIYNSEPGVIGSTEKSRFLFQLELELAKVNKNLKITGLFFKNEALPATEKNIIEIKKDDQVKKRLLEIADKGFSASSLNMFIECPLKFYFSKVAGIKSPDELTPDIESNVFGDLVHNILENIYKPFTNNIIDTHILENEIKKIDIYFENAVKELKEPLNLKAGKNILLTGIIKKYVENFVRHDIKELKKEPKILIAVEENDNETFVNIENIGEVKIKGRIDRVDRIEKTKEIRIIDYKTGKVDITKNFFWEDLITNKKLAKAFQVFLYGWLYKKVNKTEDEIRMGLYSLRTISSGFIEPNLPKDYVNFHIEFEEILKTLIKQIFDTGESFSQTDDQDICKYCDYKNICNR